MPEVCNGRNDSGIPGARWHSRPSGREQHAGARRFQAGPRPDPGKSVPSATLVAKLADDDLDTGHPTEPGEYSLTDKAYARLLQKLAENQFVQITPALRSNVLAFYADLSRPVDTKKHKDEWNKTLQALAALKGTTAGIQPSADLQ